MSLRTVILIVLILMIVGGLPTWPHSKNWTYYPSIGFGTIFLFVLILMLLGRI